MRMMSVQKRQFEAELEISDSDQHADHDTWTPRPVSTCGDACGIV